MTIRVEHGDCRDVLGRLADASVDSVVTDPPYALVSIVKRFANSPRNEHTENIENPYGRTGRGFMGKRWDTGEAAFAAEFWSEVLRVLKPGGHCLAFGGTRTYHRMACAVEDAGFEIRDMLGWLYGSGFPKSHNLHGEWEGWGTALKPAQEPICFARKPLVGTVAANVLQHGTGAINVNGCRVGETGARNNGRKVDSDIYGKLGPFERVDYGKGRWPANVIHDGSDEVLAAFPDAPGQAAAVRPDSGSGQKTNGIYGSFGTNSNHDPRGDTGTAARFFKACELGEDDLWNSDLANFAAGCSSLQSEAVVFALSHAVERSTPGSALIRPSYQAPCTNATASELRLIAALATTAIQSIAQRFSLGLPLERLTLNDGHAECVATPKPIGIITITVSHWKSSGSADPVIFSITLPSVDHGASASTSRFHYTSKADAADRLGSKHPTVKPVSLMRWLVRLVTPPGGTVLDPFAGTGTTGMACMAEGFNAILIEREAEYVADIKRRIAHVRGEDAPLFGGSDADYA